MGAVLPVADGTLETHFYLDTTRGPALAIDIANRAHAAGVIPILMLGGAGVRDAFIGAASENNRATFVTNLLNTMDQLGYDGIDLDWEPIQPEDEPLLEALITALRTERPGIILTMPVGWVSSNNSTVPSFYSTVAPDLDQINIMSYVMSGAWSGWTVWHSSALTGHGATNPSSVASCVSAYLDAGVPAGKIGVGSGFFGQCWAGGVTAPGQDIGSSWLQATDSQMSYTTIMDEYYSGGVAHYDTDAHVPYLSFSTPQGSHNCTYISYEDPQSLAAKSEYVLENQLGGIIIWTINEGYLPNQAAGSRNPLLEAITTSLWIQ
jgi:chitinase